MILIRDDKYGHAPGFPRLEAAKGVVFLYSAALRFVKSPEGIPSCRIVGCTSKSMRSTRAQVVKDSWRGYGKRERGGDISAPGHLNNSPGHPLERKYASQPAGSRPIV